MKIISILLEPTKITVPDLRLLFFVTALAPAEYSTNADILKKKDRMLFYLKKYSRPFSMKIAAILGLL